MKRIRLGTKHKALVVVASLAAGAGVGYGCIPSPDTSGLPGYDAGPSPVFDANIVTSFDGGDASPIVSEDAGNDAGQGDSGGGTGTIMGVVVDYEQGNGQGVVPGATVSVLGGPSTTTDAFGAFTLPNVLAGNVLVNVSNATDTTNNIAYSSTQVVVALGANQIASAFPVLHEGCVELVNMANVTGTKSVNFNDGTIQCPYGSTRSAAYTALAIQATSFADPAINPGLQFNGTARIEMIPIAFPTVGSTTDYSWALGLPGQATPPGLVGAVQIRVYDNSTGDVLGVRTGEVVGVTIATTQTLSADAGANAAQLMSYAASTGTWTAVTGGDGGTALTPFGGSVSGIEVGTVPTVPTLSGSWLALANPALPTTCVTGTITLASGSPAPNVLVHAVGDTFFAGATAVTDANGGFCIDIAAPVGDAGTQPGVEILAGAVSGGAAEGTQGVANMTTSSGSCATTSTCTAIGTPIQLDVLNAGCLSGTLNVQSDCTMPSLLSVELTGLTVSAGQSSAGVHSFAYVGTTAPNDAGVFCAPIVPGAAAPYLLGPGTPPTLDNGCVAQLPPAVTGSATAVTCGTGGCQDAGTVSYFAE